MVSLELADLNSKRDQLIKSVDLAVRDLLNDGSDPFALSVYLWTLLVWQA